MNHRSLAAALVAIASAVSCLSPAIGETTDTWALSTFPVHGDVLGAPGQVVGWGYEVRNESPRYWLYLFDVASDHFEYGYASKANFDFPALAPSTSVRQTFGVSTGLASLEWDGAAPRGIVNSGQFVVTGYWYDGEPFDGGRFVGEAGTREAAYRAAIPLECSIGGARRLPGGTAVSVEAVAVSSSGLVAGWVFLEAIDRSSGAKLLTNQAVAAAQTLRLAGIIDYVDGEWSIDPLGELACGASVSLSPLGVTTRSLGSDTGESLTYAGLNLTGLLVRLCGRVTAVDLPTNAIYVDDGLAFQDGLGEHSGIRVQLPSGVAPPEVGRQVAVTGVSRVEKRTLTEPAIVNRAQRWPGEVLYVPSVWARDTADLTVLL